MIKQKIKVSMFFIMIVSLLAACGETDETSGNDSSNSTESTLADINYTWGSASAGSDSFVMIEALASTVNDHVEFQNSSISTGGSVENTVLINQGELELGSSTSDVLWLASNKKEPFEDEDIDVAQIMSFVYWTVPIVTPVDSGIETLDDLRGKTVGIGNAGQSSSLIAMAIFEANDMVDDIDIEYIDGEDAANALSAGQIDATTVVHLTGSNITPAFQQLSQTLEFKPVYIEEDIIAQVADDNPGYWVQETSASTLDFYEEDIPSIGQTGILIVSPDADEESIYQLTKALLENEEQAKNIGGHRLSEFGKDFAAEGLVDVYPTHPGAIRYYEEIGLWE